MKKIGPSGVNRCKGVAALSQLSGQQLAHGEPGIRLEADAAPLHPALQVQKLHLLEGFGVESEANSRGNIRVAFDRFAQCGLSLTS